MMVTEANGNSGLSHVDGGQTENCQSFWRHVVTLSIRTF